MSKLLYILWWWCLPFVCWPEVCRLFGKEPNSRYFRLCGLYAVYVAYSHLLLCFFPLYNLKYDSQLKGCIKIGHRPNACEQYFADPCSKLSTFSFFMVLPSPEFSITFYCTVKMHWMGTILLFSVTLMDNDVYLLLYR